jgi:hypothetical protein
MTSRYSIFVLVRSVATQICCTDFLYPNQLALLARAFVHLGQDSSRFLARLRFTAISRPPQNVRSRLARELDSKAPLVHYRKDK